MKHLCNAFHAALLVFGLAGVASQPALARGGYHWDPACNCQRPDYTYNTMRTVHEAPAVRWHERYVTHTRVVRGRTRLVQENRTYLHIRPVIDREVVVHRTNTIVQDELLHRVNPIYREHEQHYREVVNRYEPGWVRHVVERREVSGCDCGYGRGLFTNGDGYRGYGYSGYSGYRGYYSGDEQVSDND